MAALLHRIGRWSATRRWSALGLWLLVIVTVAAGTLTLSRPLTDEFTIPGSRFQTVLDQLQQQLPDAAAGIGTVTFSADGGFTDAQRRAVADVTARWSQTDGVIDALDPFATQAQLDGADEELAQGRAELASGREDLAAGREELAEGQQQVDAGHERLAAAQAEVDAGRQQLEEQRARFEAARAQLPAQAAAATEQQLVGAEAELDAAQEQLDDTAARLETAAARLQAGREELGAGERELADAELRLEQGARMAALTDGLRQVSEDGSVAMTQVRFESSGGQLDPDVTEEVRRIGDSLADEGVAVSYSAEIVSDLSSILGPAEAVGLLVAAAVLLLMLGSLVAAGLPLLIAAVGVLVGLGAALSLTAAVEMTTVTPALALMLGLAVGIDYSLFILNRHRIQLRDGMPLRESIALATGTAGNAVAFAGMTVIIALTALAVTGIPFLSVMGFVAAGTVAVAVLAAVTLTPALLSLVGPRVLSCRVREGRDRSPRHADESARGWAAWVQRRPWVAIVGVTVLAGLLASPAPQLRLGLPDGSSEPAGSTAYRTYDLIREHFGAGANGPLIAVATLEEPVATDDDLAVTDLQLDLAEDLRTVDGVRHVVPFGIGEDRSTLAFQIVPEDGPSAQSTVDLVATLTAGADELGEEHGLTLGYTGQTVANIDISAQLGEALPVYLLVVVGLSLVLLLLVFRSVWVPLLATAGFLLSVAAAFGGVVATYQLGIASQVFGVHEPGPVLSFLPILLIGVLFGLAMDYQVFLVSAMREAWVHGADARSAVVSGFNHSARVVTAAAVIMVAVFGGFVFAELAMIRPIGFGLALGVLVDAFLVRMTLTPAVLSLLGERAWWLPRWLDRLLPHVDVEGAGLERSVAPDRRAADPAAGQHQATAGSPAR